MELLSNKTNYSPYCKRISANVIRIRRLTLALFIVPKAPVKKRPRLKSFMGLEVEIRISA